MAAVLQSSMNSVSGSSPSEAVAEGAHGATGEAASDERRHDPEVVEVARRRQFAASEKRALLAEAAQAKV